MQSDSQSKATLVSLPRYMLYQIGCLECGEPSEILGLFEDVDAAKRATDDAKEAHRKDWHGQRAFIVYDLTDKSEVYEK